MKILIVYVTHTGSTLHVAREIEDVLTPTHSVTLITADKVTPADISDCELLIIGSFSWDWKGHRGYPPSEMMTFLDNAKAMNLTGKKIALYGCGDKDFEHFCGALDVIWDSVSQLGVVLVGERLYLNRYFLDEFSNQQLVREWAKRLVE